jgi:O-succinylbenzoic acid--CoA ligase
VSRALILPAALRAHAASTPDAPAILEPGRTWSFATLDAHADALAAGLVAAGVRPGDRVALLAAPSATAIALFAAAGRIGACVAPLGTLLTAPELAAAGVEIGPRLVVHDGEHATGAGALGVPTARLEALAVGVGDAAVPAMRDAPTPVTAGATDAVVPLTGLDPNAPAVAVLTSGTTGRPKAALLSHAAMAASACAWSAALPQAAGWLLCLGLAHVAGLGVAWRAIGAGVPLSVVPAFETQVVLDALRRGPASHVSLVPTQLARLLDADDAARATGDSTHSARWALSGLRAVLLGGGPIPPGLVTRALAAGWPVVPTYGLTEAGSGVTALATADAKKQPESAGRPLPGVELRIADSAADSTGEICVRTSAVFSGYLGRPEATVAAFDPDGWLRTGDAGRLDADGFLHVLDRRDDLLVSGGENVVPAEVEAALASHPAIDEAGVVGRPDPTWGAVPVAAVVLRPGASAPTNAELRAFCAARLAPYKVPVAFFVVAALPRTPSDKLRRAELRMALDGAPRAALIRDTTSRRSIASRRGRGAHAAGASTRTFSARDGAGLFYRAFAAAHGAERGVPIVLLHATLSASVQLVGLARLLSARGPVFVLDRRGSGESAMPAPLALDVAVHVADVAGLLDTEEIAAAILVGHSFGGVVALETAARLPERTCAVVAWEPPYGPLADAETRAGFAAVAAETARAHAAGGSAAAGAAFLDGVAGDGAWQALPNRTRAFLSAQGDGAYADAALGGLDPGGLSRIVAPVTVLTGTGSEPFYAPIARAVVERVPGARLVALDGLRHAAPITDAGPVAAAILDALAAAGTPTQVALRQ